LGARNKVNQWPTEAIMLTNEIEKSNE